MAQGVFYVNGGTDGVVVQYQGDQLKWQQQTQLLPQHALDRTDIVGVLPIQSSSVARDGSFEVHCWPLDGASGCCSSRSRRQVTHTFLSVDGCDALMACLCDAVHVGRPRRLKVLINPVGGPGKAMSVWTEQVLPMMQAANIKVDMEQTQYYVTTLTCLPQS